MCLSMKTLANECKLKLGFQSISCVFINGIDLVGHRLYWEYNLYSTQQEWDNHWSHLKVSRLFKVELNNSCKVEGCHPLNEASNVKLLAFLPFVNPLMAFLRARPFPTLVPRSTDCLAQWLGMWSAATVEMSRINKKLDT